MKKMNTYEWWEGDMDGRASLDAEDFNDAVSKAARTGLSQIGEQREMDEP